MRFRLFSFALLFAQLAAAQTPDASRRLQGVSVSGFVRDSLANAPLVGAMVQLVPADGGTQVVRTALTDPYGYFTLTDVPAGSFTIGFFHPMLDSVGLAPPVRAVSVDGQSAVRADLGMPSPTRFRTAICGARPARDSAAILVGFVRDAEGGQPVSGATVLGEWLEVTFGRNAVTRRVPRLVAKTGENGWFAMCNVPTSGTMLLTASRGADSTDRIELRIPASGFARRDMFLGAVNTVASTGSPAQTASTARAPRPLHMGSGRINGTVYTSGGKPLAGANVRITDGPETRTNEQGEWAIVNSPPGTRMLEVYALGFYPERRRVDVIAGAPAVHVALSTLRAVLDTVRISATRRGNDRDLIDFNNRRRTGIGQYITATDIVRRNPVLTSELFRSMSGVRIDMDPDSHERYVMVRGNAGDWCQASIYLNGRHLYGVSADDMDVWVRPGEVAGVEVYAGLGAPLEYQPGMTGCGSVVIWTK